MSQKLPRQPGPLGNPPGRRPRAGAARSAKTIALLVTAVGLTLAGCSETSLNEAPVVDLSVQSRAAAPKPPPMAIPAQPGETLYIVKKGDTLFHLASVAGATMQDLARWNGIDEHAPIFVGQQLRLQAPPASPDAPSNGPMAGAPVAPADTGAETEAVATPIPLGGGGGVETRALDAPSSGSTSPAVSTAAAPEAAGGLPPTPPGAGALPGAASTLPAAPAPSPLPSLPPSPPPPAPAAPPGAAPAGWIWPVDGPVTSKFDAARKGIEIAAAEDAPVKAVADGTVSYVGSPRDYGNLVILKHSEELLSVYAHNKTLLVKEGQAVQRGQTIATAGKTPGMPATIHFEVRRNHVAIDPLDVLPPR